MGTVCYEARKWVLAEDTPGTLAECPDNYEKWMDVALVVGVMAINRLLNHTGKIFDVSELLPPFDGLDDLIENDVEWWTKMRTMIDRDWEAETTDASDEENQDKEEGENVSTNT